MSHGIVVEHKENGVRYAISEGNFNPKVHKKVRDLKPGESVLGYKPRRVTKVGDVAPVTLPDKPDKTEGSSPEGTKEAK
ncbi:hypothetical protein SEA_THERESITA_13 [Microbacterium phage Theresita]|nr:hypothetical protein SEA_THERESITA_13 [Microbacterium phage Theresita]